MLLKKTMKSIFILLAGISLLMGCGDNSQDNQDTSKDVEETSEEQEYDVEELNRLLLAETSRTEASLEKVKDLVAKGADVNAWSSSIHNRGKSHTPLMFASHFGHLEIVKFLVKSGADINAKNNVGATALFYADVRGRHKVQDYLESLDAKCDIGWIFFVLSPVCWL